MSDILLKLTDVCDGVRCDMAMLPLNNVFHNTWLGVLNKHGFSQDHDARVLEKCYICCEKKKSASSFFLVKLIGI